MSTEITDDTKEDVARRLDIQNVNEFTIPSGVNPLPLKNPNQLVAIINLTHLNHRPKSLMPGFRIIGLFRDNESAQSYVKKAWVNVNDSVYLIPVHQLFVICSSTTKQSDEVYNNNKLKQILDMHAEQKKQNEIDFRSNIENKTTGKTSKNRKHAHTKVRESIIKKKFTEDVGDMDISDPLHSNIKISGQEYVVIMVMLDKTPHNAVKEPAIAILAAFNTEMDAEHYAKYTAASQYPDSDISVVCICSWCFPENIDYEQVKEVYRNEKLNDIMSTRKTQQQMSKQFEQWCTENKQSPNYIDVETDKIPDNKTKHIADVMTVTKIEEGHDEETQKTVDQETQDTTQKTIDQETQDTTQKTVDQETQDTTQKTVDEETQDTTQKTVDE